MKISISQKIQWLIIAAVVITGSAVCTVSFFEFRKGFADYTHNEITRTGSSIRTYISDLQNHSLGSAASLAARPDVIEAVALKNTPGLQKIAAAENKNLLVDFITIADSTGTVIARGHSDKAGDSVMNQENVIQALQGKSVSCVEAGTVVKFSLRSGVPVYKNGVIIGSVTAGYNFSTDAFVDTIKNNYGVECTIFQGDTRVSTTVMDTDGKRIVGTTLTNNEIIDAVLKQAQIYIGSNNIQGKTYDTSYWPIRDASGNPSGIFFIGKDMAVIRAQLLGQLAASVLLTLICALVITVICTVVVRSIVKPVKNVTRMLKDISEGSGDLTKRITITASDEIGDMATYFNATLEKVKDLVVEIEKQSGILSNIGQDLSSNMDETAASVTQISTHIKMITGETEQQSASIGQTGTAVGTIKDTIETLNQFISQQSASVTESSAAIEQMVSNIASVTKTLARNEQNITGLQESSQKGKADISNISAEIEEVAKQSAGLAEITAIIQNIAQQTNLLAMNAAIEAAHAGNAGQGFSVVSDEIRKLAESSSSQTKTISKVLSSIQKSIAAITEESSVAIRQFNQIEEKVRAVSAVEDEIRHAMLEQNEGSKEITIAVEQLNDITVEVKSNADEILRQSQQVYEQSSVLGQINEKVSGSISEMASGVGEINLAVTAVNQVTALNRESIGVLREKVGKFKTTESASQS
jgi:methyl-accepting chemotaxis protein